MEAGVQTALALGATVNMISQFDRKHYFYCDLPVRRRRRERERERERRWEGERVSSALVWEE